jgi:hypothetical protein
VQLLAKSGGWVPHKDRRPGKITLMRGLRRLLDMLATQAMQYPRPARLETSSTGSMIGCQLHYRQNCLPQKHQSLYWQRQVPPQVPRDAQRDKLK